MSFDQKPIDGQIFDELKNLDLSNMTPLEALNTLSDLQAKLEDEAV